MIALAPKRSPDEAAGSQEAIAPIAAAGTFEIRAKEKRGLFLASDGRFITGQVIDGITLYEPVRTRVTRYRHRGARIPTQ